MRQRPICRVLAAKKADKKNKNQSWGFCINDRACSHRPSATLHDGDFGNAHAGIEAIIAGLQAAGDSVAPDIDHEYALVTDKPLVLQLKGNRRKR